MGSYTRNIRLHIQYLGTNYFGWQRQSDKKTIQGELEKALNRLTKENCNIIGSGRTDAGVHAICQVANLKTNSTIPITGFLKGLNSILPEDIAILHVEEAALDFHARKHAKNKLYLYRIYESEVRRPMLLNRAWMVRPPLNREAMIEACHFILGTHDFKAFQKTGSSVKTTVRTVTKCEIIDSTVEDERILEIQVAANGFLRYMVRNIVGLLVEIGRGKRSPQDVKDVLDAGIRLFHWQTAPPYGLYLKKVYY